MAAARKLRYSTASDVENDSLPRTRHTSPTLCQTVFHFPKSNARLSASARQCKTRPRVYKMASIHRARNFLLLYVCSVYVVTVQGLYSASGPVKILTPSNFDTSLKSGVWLVEFYAPWCGHCKNLKPEYEKAAKGVDGIVNVGAVDADAHGQFAGQYQIQGFPTIMLMYSMNGNIKKLEYSGGRTASEMVGWALDQAKGIALKRIGAKSGGSKSSKSGGGRQGDSGFYSSSSGVVMLTEGSFDEDVMQSEDLWFVEFFAPWCGHCKSLKPEYESAASELQGKVKLGAVDCTAEESLCARYGVRGYPTIKFFGPNKESPENYESGRDSASIVQFGDGQWSKLGPPPQVKELTDQFLFEQECLGDADEGKKPKKLCLLSFLPDILDSKASGRQGYLDILSNVAQKFKGAQFAYLWMEAGKQPKLEANFDVGGYGYPAMVGYAPAKGKMIPMTGAFDADHVAEFISSLRHGLGRPQSLVGELADVESVAPWDGSDAEEVLEEEFDLSELMNEEL